MELPAKLNTPRPLAATTYYWVYCLGATVVAVVVDDVDDEC